MRGAFLLIVTALAACSTQAPTRIELEVTTAAGVSLDDYQIKVGSQIAVTGAAPALEVEVSDALAGHPAMIEVWGLSAGLQVAFGTATVTPMLHGTVTVDLAMSALSCGSLCTEGTVECMANGTITCEMQPDGCLAWSTAVACPAAAPDCSNGVCAATCTDECTVGATECDSATTARSCGQRGSDGCLDWSPSMLCPGDHMCNNSRCDDTTTTCTHDGDSCDDGNPCTQDDTCSDGTCSGMPKCAAPANGDATCAADGTCGFTCHAGFIAGKSTCAATAVAPMPTARGWLAAATGTDHRIYVAGGDTATSPEATPVSSSVLEIYTPSTNTWSTGAALPVALYSLGLVAGSDGTIYAIGGATNTTSSVVTVYAYSPTTNTWTTRASMSTARGGAAVALGPDGRIYAFGGYQTGALMTAEAYDPTHDAWTTVAPPLAAVAFGGAAVGGDGLLYVASGQGPLGTNTTMSAYTPSANTWAARSPWTTAHDGAAVVAGADGLIYTFAGDDGTSVYATVNQYSPTTNAWTTRTSMTMARTLAAAAVDDGLVYVIGGYGAALSTPQASVEVFSPASNAW